MYRRESRSWRWCFIEIETDIMAFSLFPAGAVGSLSTSPS